VSDYLLLNSESYKPGMTVKQIRLCGESQSFKGIQLILYEPGLTKSMQLNPIGMTIGCTVWSVPTGDYISKITIKYNQEIGVNYFVA
jgi:hypothetical protein